MGCIWNKKVRWISWLIIVQYATLLLTDVFKKFREKCIEMYELDLEHLLSEPGLA